MSIKEFRGLNNVSDAMRLDMRWLVKADNVDIDNTGSLSKRGGYFRTMTGSQFTAFTTKDFQRMYLVDGGVLKNASDPGTMVSLLAGLSARTMRWTEVNDQVFYNNGVDSGVILPDNTVLPWSWPVPGTPTPKAVTGQLPPGLYRVCCTYTLPDGRETGSGDFGEIVLAEGQALQVQDIPHVAGLTTNLYIAPANSSVYQSAGTPSGNATVWNSSPDLLGVDLQTESLDPLPAGCDVIQAWGGQIYAAQYLPQDDQTVVWFSKPLGYHLFDLSADYIIIPGRVHMLAWHADALLIGADSAIHSYDGKDLNLLADYGVVPGEHWAPDGVRTLFWSTRGLCAALPFKNLTEDHVSVAPGVSAGGALIQSGGQKRYVVALKQGGSAFNSHT